MKSEKGVTLTALVAYICAFVIILGIVTTISSHFYKNVGQIKETPQYIAEFNKYNMLFVADVKKYRDYFDFKFDNTIWRWNEIFI